MGKHHKVLPGGRGYHVPIGTFDAPPVDPEVYKASYREFQEHGQQFRQKWNALPVTLGNPGQTFAGMPTRFGPDAERECFGHIPAITPEQLPLFGERRRQ